MERLSTGVDGLDSLLEGGIPRSFFVAVTGEPGTGKTILCISFIAKGVEEGDKCIYVTTEESKESIINQALQFGMDLNGAVEEKRLVIIDALMGGDERWSMKSLELDELVEKVLEAKRYLGYGRARLVVDSMSAFWLDRPAMARKYSYYLKKVLAKWDFTVMATSQYAISTSQAFGWGLEHVADGIIRFRRALRGGKLRRYVIIEKMRQTNHDLRLYEIEIMKGKGLVIIGPAGLRKEDVTLPKEVSDRIKKVNRKAKKEIP